MATPPSRSSLLLLLLGACAAAPSTRPHATEALQPYVADNAHAPGQEALPALLDALTSLLDEPDPALRDDLGYVLLARWIVRDGVVPDAELRRMLDTLSAGVATRGSDDRAVLRRSFSMLCLSLLTKRDLDHPWLTQNEFGALLDLGISYLGGERDLRGYDAQLGWVHATAHTADLLKFVARSPRLEPAQQRRLVVAIAERVRSAPTTFAAGEDLRLARALLAATAREDFDAQALAAALETMSPADDAPMARRIAQQENYNHVLFALHALLQLDKRNRPGFTAAERLVREALGG